MTNSVHNSHESSFLSGVINVVLVTIYILALPGVFLGWGLGRASMEKEMMAVLMNVPEERETDYQFDFYRRQVVSDSVQQAYIHQYYAYAEPAVLGIKVRDISEVDKARMIDAMTNDMPHFINRSVPQHIEVALEWMVEYYILCIAFATLFFSWRFSRKYRVWKRRYFRLYEKINEFELEKIR